MPEVRITKPAVTRINWVLNPFDANVQVQGPDGRPASQIVAIKKGLTIGITPYLGASKLTPESYFYGEDTPITEATVLPNAGVDVAATWATALDSMSNIFPVLAEPTSEQLDDGLPYYMRLDAWQANINYEQGEMSNVSAFLGFYSDAAFTAKPSGMIELVFLDSEGLAARQQNLDTHAANLAYYESVIAGTSPGFADLSQADKDQQTAQAVAGKAATEKALDQLNAQLVGNMVELLTAPGVPESVGALVMGVFVANKAGKPQWANVDIATLMADFQVTLTNLLS